MKSLFLSILMIGVGIVIVGCEDDDYILTSNGYWSASDGCSWNGITPKDGDTIIVNGVFPF